ncbi:hypothetical protein ACFVSW_23060 [Neobacillus sp. NPDC058068]|uniref:hypothetical protein n=1 Tax=Neobacillus sp. NPDC058068 TaxID=3346325 RepID=UPI0036DB82EE
MTSILDSVIFPDDILEGMRIESIIISPIAKHLGVAALSGKSEDMHVLRLYQLILREDQNYVPTFELEAFAFYSRKDLTDFVVRLPEMSAIEILMVMNQEPTMTH